VCMHTTLPRPVCLGATSSLSFSAKLNSLTRTHTPNHNPGPILRPKRRLCIGATCKRRGMLFRCSADLDHIYLSISCMSPLCSLPSSLPVCPSFSFSPSLHLSLQDARLINGFKQADGDRRKFLECCKSILQVWYSRMRIRIFYSPKIFTHLNVII